MRHPDQDGEKSNRLGMSPLIRRAERVVETHREVADEEADGGGHFEFLRVHSSSLNCSMLMPASRTIAPIV